MSANWMDVSSLSFNSILLLERLQLSWFPGWLPEMELSIALQANPVVDWWMRHKCPEIEPWLDEVLKAPKEGTSPLAIRLAEVRVLKSITDLLVYAIDPTIYDAQPFLKWDSRELTGMADFKDKIVIDVGAGTGRLSLLAAQSAKAVFCVEPVENLRRYLKDKARKSGFNNIFPVDGTITEMPFPDQFTDIMIAGHIFGDQLEQEYTEMARVTKNDGKILLCPGNNDQDNKIHLFLLEKGFLWSSFEEPVDGMKRKYWKSIL
jgi:SAM-dependent methyltransferase